MTKRKPTPAEIKEAITRPPGTIPIAEAAKRIGLDRATVWKMFMAGEIRGWRKVSNRRVWIYETACDEYIANAIAADPTRKPPR